MYPHLWEPSCIRTLLYIGPPVWRPLCMLALLYIGPLRTLLYNDLLVMKCPLCMESHWSTYYRKHLRHMCKLRLIYTRREHGKQTNRIALAKHHVSFCCYWESSLSINALHACVYIYIWQLSSFRVPTLWFIDLTVITCHIQYTFLSLCQFFLEKMDKTLR